MGNTYTRQSSYTDGDVIQASNTNNEFDQLVSAFNESTGHTHDGTSAEGGPVTKLLGTSLTFGDATSGTDITVTFDGESNDGVLKWMEDEDYFEFSDDILIATTEKLQFRDTAIYINSSADGQLDLVADTEIQIAATTVDINGLVDISGNLTVGGDLSVAGTTSFSGGTLNLGDGAGDSVVFGADVNSSIIPNTDSAFDLGSASQEWRDLFLDGTANIDTASIDNISDDTLVATNKKIQFRDTAISVSSSADATLDIASDGAINLTAGTDVVIPANVGITFGTGEKIEGDSTDLTVTSGADINLTATADVNIPSGVGLTFGDDGEKIEGDGTDLTISGNNINLTAVADVNIPSGVGLTFATAEKIESDGTDLSITVGSGGDINIPADIGLTFGNDGEKIEGDGTDLTISGNNINLTAVADIVVPANVGLTFGTGEKIEGDSTDLTVTSGAKINLTATSDVHIPNDVGIVFGGASEKIEGDGTDLTISGAKINLNATTDVHLANNIGVVFGDAGEKIEGDGTNLAINSSGDVNITATTVDLNGNLEVSGTTAQVGVLTTTATQVATGGITSGSNIVSDTDSTDDLGTNSVRWANLYVDGITATDQITATGFTGTLDGVLGSGTAAAATVTSLDTSAAVNLNLTTDSTSSTSGALIVDGGVGIAKKLFVGTDLDVDGTTNLDAVDIDGAVDMATTLTVAGKTTTNEIDLTAIAASIDDTAVDVFVYDTSKDSDGGAWRKRTQNTSWYNEALGTATRGSRKEFPAVAVLVYEEDQVTIYDGDDPDMPMWMVFNASSSGNFNLLGATSRTSSALAALNAEFMFCSTNGQNQTYINFITDFGCLIYNGTGVLMDIYNGNIAERNAQKHYRGGPVDRISTSILDREVNDVSMAVMPNSYVDLATGLPRSTIALATANGTTFITDSGDVLKSGDTSYKVNTIVLLPTREVYLGQGTGSNEGYVYYKDFQQINNGFSVATYANSDQRFHVLPADGDACILGADNNDDILISDVSLSEGVAIGMPLGLTKVSLYDYKCHNTGTLPAPVSTFIASDYNTGNMVGDIKLATLSDTSTTNVTGAELAPDNTATSTVTEANATTGWTNSGLATFASSSTQAFLGTYSLQGIADSNGDLAHCTFTTVVGQCYAGSAAAYVVNGQGFTLKVGTSAGNNSYYESSAYTTAAWKVFSFSFVATSTSAFISLTESSSSNNTSFFVDAVTVRLAEKDRTYNSNDLQIFGTPTKTVVATGNDLVAYAGFTTDGNYLQQTYNPDFDFTGDFSITGWFKNATSGDPFIMRLRDSTSAGAGFLISTGSNSTLTFAIYTSGFQATGRTSVGTSATHTNAYWEQVTAVRRKGTLEIWVNGELVNTTAGTAPADLTDTTAFPPTKLGQDYNNGAHFGGSLALWRVSATAPSAEQIYKMYNDEHVLFQPGAQATLYDDTNAITDVAFDDVTNLLHVGTADGRSTFQGLRRVENTTTAVGTSISASNGLVAED